jgi:2-iminobutanoate/2-iminopropanoate deaminase
MPAMPPMENTDIETAKGLPQCIRSSICCPTPKPVAPYSHAVESGGFVFVTGQLATDPDDDSLPIPPGIEAQTRKVMDNLERVLKGCSLTFANVVCVRIFLTDFKGDYAKMNAIFSTFFADDKRPARTTVGVTDLARGGIVEIDMIAVRF